MRQSGSIQRHGGHGGSTNRSSSSAPTLCLCVEISSPDPQAAFARHAASSLTKTIFVAILFLFVAIVANAQGSTPAAGAGDELVVEGNYANDVFGLGRNVRVRGDVKNGVLAFGGDVIIEGRVEGDAAAIGGSVIQLKGSYVGGDVMVLGGEYRQEGGPSERHPAGRMVIVAGYEQELRGLARNPFSLLTPEFSLTFVGWRVLAVLFWFVASLALTAATPGAVSRAAARLQLTSPRVAVIGLLGALVVGPGAFGALRVLPPMLSGLVFITAMLLLVVSYLFGRVVVNAVTGRWLQRVLLPEGKRSESVALLLGAGFWAVVLALPFVWPFCVLGLVVLSLGLALTARYRLNWRRA
jgi:hypothetical protein